MNSILHLALLSCLLCLGSCKSQTYTRGGHTLVFVDKANRFNATTQNRMVNTFFTVYPKQVNSYNKASPRKVTFLVDPNFHGVVSARGSVVRLDPTYFAFFSNDIDVVTHETTHIVQGYRGRAPGRLLRNEGAGWSLPAFRLSQSYTNGYGVAARFFVWLERKVKPGFVKAFDSAIRAGKYAGFFESFAGKTVNQPWAQYARNPAI